MFKITSSNNQIIKDVKKLTRRRNRWKEGNFIVEGIKIIEEAIKEKVKINYIICSESIIKEEGYINLLKQIPEKVTIIEVPDKIFREIADTENPQGILGVLNFLKNDVSDLIDSNKKSLFLVDALQDPGNLGTIIRTADAFNIDGIVIGQGSVDPYNEKVVRSTMGSIFRVPIYVLDDTISTLEELQNNGYKLLATDLKGEYVSSNIFNEDKQIIIIGNESNGVSDEILNLSDRRIKIPMPGNAESLNAGVAASILMYEVMKSSI